MPSGQSSATTSQAFKGPELRGVKQKKRRISMGPQEKTAFTLFPDKYVGILRNGWDKRTPKRTFVWRDECRQRNYSKFSSDHSASDCLRNKGKLFFTFQRIHIRSVAAFEGRNTAEKSHHKTDLVDVYLKTKKKILKKQQFYLKAGAAKQHGVTKAKRLFY